MIKFFRRMNNTILFWNRDFHGIKDFFSLRISYSFMLLSSSYLFQCFFNFKVDKITVMNDNCLRGSIHGVAFMRMSSDNMHHLFRKPHSSASCAPAAGCRIFSPNLLLTIFPSFISYSRSFPTSCRRAPAMRWSLLRFPLVYYRHFGPMLVIRLV